MASENILDISGVEVLAQDVPDVTEIAKTVADVLKPFIKETVQQAVQEALGPRNQDGEKASKAPQDCAVSLPKPFF